MKSAKKRLLILTDWYTPAVKAGGPVRSVSAIVDALKSEFDISVLTSDRDFGDTIPFKGIETNSWIQKKDYRVQYISPNRLESTIKSETELEYDKVYLNSLFSKHFTINVLRLLNKSRKSSVVLAPRGMLAQNALGLKRVKKKVFLTLAKTTRLFSNITWHASTDLEKQEILAIFPSAEVISLENLAACKPSEFQPISKEDGVLKMVFVSRISPKKNLLFLLELLDNFQNENITLDIYGPKEDLNYWEKCQLKIGTLKGVTYKGVLQHYELQTTLCKYHLFVLPTLNENFGHIILEALNSSLPLLLSDNTPWLQLKEKGIGASLSLNTPNEWVFIIKSFIDMNEENYGGTRQRAWQYGQNKLNQEDLLKEYIQLFS